jgi:peptidoglycan-associated lipoprotein
MTKTIRSTQILSVAIAVAFLGACATSKSVDEKIAQKLGEAQSQNDKKIESVETQVEALQQHQKDTDIKVDQLSQEAKDALQRAQEAGVLAKGKVAFQETFKDDRIHFKTDSYDLDNSAKAALDEFSSKVKALNDQYYIEIQGHTDDTGSTRHNDELGARRADAVRRYLGRNQKVPLVRMSTISYGDTLPVAPNKKKAGRAENRRVVLVVME